MMGEKFISHKLRDTLQKYMVEKIVTILYLSGDPVAIAEIAKLLQITLDEVETTLPSVQKGVGSLGLRFIRNGDEIAIVTAQEQSELVEAFWKEELKGDLTPATLQVLTLVAYLGNPTRQTISFIRGVQSSQSIRTLSVRGLIKREGEVCTLTTDALKHLGITSVEELPQYKEIHDELLEKMKSIEG